MAIKTLKEAVDLMYRIIDTDGDLIYKEELRDPEHPRRAKLGYAIQCRYVEADDDAVVDPAAPPCGSCGVGRWLIADGISVYVLLTYNIDTTVRDLVDCDVISYPHQVIDFLDNFQSRQDGGMRWSDAVADTLLAIGHAELTRVVS